MKPDLERAKRGPARTLDRGDLVREWTALKKQPPSAARTAALATIRGKLRTIDRRSQ